MRNMKRLLIIISGFLVLSCTIVFATVSISRSKGANDVVEKVLSDVGLLRLRTIVNNIKKYYYKPISEDELLKEGLSGMLSGLDPHSAYLGPEEIKDLETDTTGKFGGIGIEMIPDRGAIKVITPLDDTPAYKAKMKAGDYIVQIDGKLVQDMTLKEAVNMMKGKKGTKLKLTVIRKNESKPLVFNLRRAIIKIKTIKHRMLAPGYGYIRLAMFQDPTAKDLVRAIKKLQSSSKGGLEGLILDIRNNPGGLFESSVQIADYFLDSRSLSSNDMIVYAQGQVNASKIVAKATPGELLPKIPLVVLINEGSASAAEIVAGALQDHKRAIIVGTRSFGKGSVQTLIPIDKTSAIKLTTALYYTPLGRLIQAKGIQPDITVKDLQLAKNNLDNQDLIRIDESTLIDHIKNGSSKKDIEKKKKQARAELELAYKDYQLYEALHILKSQNLTNH